jgi:hypothetical protein
MDTISIIILSAAIITISMIMSIIVFVIMVGPKRIIESVNNLKEIINLLETAKRQGYENLAIHGRTTKVLQLQEEYISELNLQISNTITAAKNIQTCFPQVSDVSDQEKEIISCYDDEETVLLEPGQVYPPSSAIDELDQVKKELDQLIEEEVHTYRPVTVVPETDIKNIIPDEE